MQSSPFPGPLKRAACQAAGDRTPAGPAGCGREPPGGCSLSGCRRSGMDVTGVPLSRKMALDEYLRGEDERQLLQKRMQAAGRLPPGQSATIKWPVLHQADVPRFDPDTWDFRAGGLVESP